MKPLVGLGACVFVILVGQAGGVRAQHSGQVQHVHLGPDLGPPVFLESPTVAYRIGEPSGTGILDQGEVVWVSPVPEGGFLLFTAFAGSGPVQHWEHGRLALTFGGPGRGPGEYQFVGGLAVDPDGHFWVEDATRMVSFTAAGEPREVIDKTYAGSQSRETLFLTDGSLLVNGPGSRDANLGYLLHRYDFDTGAWTSHYPLFRDSTFASADFYRWSRKLALLPNGKLVQVTSDYTMEILDPSEGFNVEAVIHRRPLGWPADISKDLSERQELDGLIAPRFRVQDAWVDEKGRLWVTSTMPEKGWRDEVRPLPDAPPSEVPFAFSTEDKGTDALVEVFDLEAPKLLVSYRLDPRAIHIVGMEAVAYYVGDLPYPQMEILRIPVN